MPIRTNKNAVVEEVPEIKEAPKVVVKKAAKKKVKK